MRPGTQGPWHQCFVPGYVEANEQREDGVCPYAGLWASGAGVKAFGNFIGDLTGFAGFSAFCQLRGEFTEFLRRHGFGHELDFQPHGSLPEETEACEVSSSLFTTTAIFPSGDIPPVGDRIQSASRASSQLSRWDSLARGSNSVEGGAYPISGTAGDCVFALRIPPPGGRRLPVFRVAEGD